MTHLYFRGVSVPPILSEVLLPRVKTTNRTILGAQRDALSQSNIDHITFTIEKPLLETTNESPTLEGWESSLNWGEGWDTYRKFEFGSGCDYGSTGYDWTAYIVDHLFEPDGMYGSRIRDDIQRVSNRLLQGNYGSATNALVIQTYTRDDLKEVTDGRPIVPGIPCLTQIQVKPTNGKLNIYATMRSQYVDSKLTGNLAALSILNGYISNRVGLDPGRVVQHTHNICQHGDGTELEEVLAANTN